MSNLKTKRVQIGDHSTATNNFVMHQSDTPDGKVHISNGTLDDHTSKMTLAHDGKLGIGTDSPTSGLHVQTDTNPVMKVSRGTNNAANINLYYNTTFTGQVSGSAGAFQLSSVGSSTPMQFYTDGSKNMEIDENGYVTMDSQPSFAASKTSGHVNSVDQIYIANIVRHNIGGHYNSSTGRFTAPTSGRYFISTMLMSLDDQAYNNKFYRLRVNGSAIQNVYSTTSGASGHHQWQWSGVISLNAQDYVDLQINNVAMYGSNQLYSWFSGHLLG
jgi:hypothetical protein